MTTMHPALEFVAGDDWEILATLLDESGSPYDLTGAAGAPQLKFVMYDYRRRRMIDAGDSTITILSGGVGGKVSVKVSSAFTATIPGGLYHDALRLSMAGQTGTLLMGQIGVIGDPWRAAATRERMRLRLVSGGMNAASA